MWKKAALIAAVSLVVVLIASAFLFGPKDKQLIQEALDNSIKASRTGQPGGVAEYLSRNATFDEGSGGIVIDKGSLPKIIRFLKPDIEVMNREPVIQGSKATIVSPVNLTLNTGEDKSTTRVDNVTITFTRETGMRWGVVPYPKWRISEIRADGFDPGIFMGGLP